jgi:transcriptional regulator with XRE-family HTH domain
MAEFNHEKIGMFLGVVRKYMQVRGPMSQKDLAEMAGVGVSTMSRFLNQKTSDLNPQLIANITAKLNIPLYEIVDFVEEDYTDTFIRLVKFYKESEDETSEGPNEVDDDNEDTQTTKTIPNRRQTDNFDDAFTGALGTGTAKRSASANISIGGKKRNISFSPDEGAKNSEMSMREKIENLSPRQKAYMSDFLDLDMEARDLMVDIGGSLLRYFRHKGMQF